MKVIKNFALIIEPEQFVEIPFNSEVIWMGLINNQPTLSVLTDTAYSGPANTTRRKFLMYADNKEISHQVNRTHYVGSFEFAAEVGRRILHVFEE